MSRTERKTVRLSPRERHLLEAAAENAGEDLSAFIRDAALDRAADDLLPASARRSDGDRVEHAAGAGR